MTDADLVTKRLARIETCVQELRTLGNPGRIATDLREQRFFEHTLQIAIQSALDVASHIVSDRRLGEPQSNHDLLDLLVRYGWIPAELAQALHRMVGFRNILVRGYETVDLVIVEDVARNHLDDLLAFAREIRRHAALNPPPAAN